MTCQRTLERTLEHKRTQRQLAGVLAFFSQPNQPANTRKPAPTAYLHSKAVMQAIFTLALVLNAWFSGGSSCVDAAADALMPVPAPASFPEAPVAISSDNGHTEVGLHASGRVVRIGSARGAAPASIIARRKLDGDYSYQHPTLSAGRNGQAPPRKINT